jgi:hypothetical protein
VPLHLQWLLHSIEQNVWLIYSEMKCGLFLLLAWNFLGHSVERHKGHPSGQDSYLQEKNSTRYLPESFTMEEILTANEYVLHIYETVLYLKGLLIVFIVYFRKQIHFY